VLIGAHPTVGHGTGLITIGRTLQDLGADVRFGMSWKNLPKVPLPAMVTTALSLRAMIEQARLRFVPLPVDLRMLAYAMLMPRTSGARELRLAARMMTTGVAHLVDRLERELDASPADVIVADFGFLAGWLVAERRRLPLVTFFHSGLPFLHDGEHPFTGGAEFSRAVDRRVGDIRKGLGLPPVAPGLLDSPYSPDLNLLATTPALEGRDAEFGQNTHWLGPCVDGRVETAPFDFARLRPEATKVYLSLGTVFNGHPSRFRALIEGLEGPGIQIVVSAGASYGALAAMASSDLLICARVPQLAVLDAVDFVVSHGGNNTVNETLLAGRPLLVVPIGGEQEANASRVERLGAGIALDRKKLTPTVVRAAFERLRSTPSHRQRAEAIAAAASTQGRGAAEAARLIIQLAARRSA
jgi:MGT family glycosyltransferase